MKETTKASSVYANISSCTLSFVDGKKVNISGGGKRSLIVSVLLNDSDFTSLNELVMMHFKNAETLPDLARMCGYSCTKTFTRHFIKHFSETPKQWILRMRQEEMILMLKETTYCGAVTSGKWIVLIHFPFFCKQKSGPERPTF